MQLRQFRFTSIASITSSREALHDFCLLSIRMVCSQTPCSCDLERVRLWVAEMLPSTPLLGAASRKLEILRHASFWDTVAEWSGRRTRNPPGSARRGSNPLGVVSFLIFVVLARRVGNLKRLCGRFESCQGHHRLEKGCKHFRFPSRANVFGIQGQATPHPTLRLRQAPMTGST
jgi:hypothetical protein